MGDSANVVRYVSSTLAPTGGWIRFTTDLLHLHSVPLQLPPPVTSGLEEREHLLMDDPTHAGGEIMHLVHGSETPGPGQWSNSYNLTLTQHLNETADIDSAILCNISGHQQVSLVAPLGMSLLGILGNALALFVLYRTRGELRRSVFYTLVACLAVTDLLGQTFATPIVVVAYARGGWPGGRPFCQLHGFLMVGFGLVTPLLVSLMALERLGALCCTYFTSRFLSKSRVRAALAGCWVFAMGFAALPFVGFGTYEKQCPETWCFLKFHFDRETVESGWVVDAVYSCLYAAINLLVIALSIISNVFVIVMLLRARQRRRVLTNKMAWRRTSSGRKIFDGSQRRDSVRKNGDLELQMVWLLCGMTLVFTCCWTPFMYQIIMSVASGASRHSATDMMVVRAAAFNQILDPWVYILLRRSLLRKVKVIFLQILGLREAAGCGGKSSSTKACNRVSCPLNIEAWPAKPGLSKPGLSKTGLSKPGLSKQPVAYVDVCNVHIDAAGPSRDRSNLNERSRSGNPSFKEKIHGIMGDPESFLSKKPCYRTSSVEESGVGIALLPRNLLLDNPQMTVPAGQSGHDSNTDNYLGHIGRLLREVDSQSYPDGESSRPATCGKGSA